MVVSCFHSPISPFSLLSRAHPTQLWPAGGAHSVVVLTLARLPLVTLTPRFPVAHIQFRVLLEGSFSAPQRL